MNERKPAVFIGSSSEGRNVADALQVALDSVCEVEVWSQGTFGLSEGTLESLVKALDRFDFAILVATADDLRESRGRTNAVPRDNVVFELGLFMGGLGPKRTFIVHDRSKDLQLPSDLAGVTKVDYAMHASGNVQSSTGAAATRIRTAIERAGRRQNDLNRRLEAMQRTVIASSETGPDEQAYFDKFSQLLDVADVSALTLLYVDIDSLRSITREVFREEKDQRIVTGRRLGRRPESEIREEFLLALSIALADAIYELHPLGLKHDIFQLPDPDTVMVARELPYDDAWAVAQRVQQTFQAECVRLLPTAKRQLPSVTVLVANAAKLRSLVPDSQAAHLHEFLRRRLKELKDTDGRGRVYGHDELHKPTPRP